MYKLPYGNKEVEFFLPKHHKLEILEVEDKDISNDQQGMVQQAIQNPLVKDLPLKINSRDKICIIISDLSRPVPNQMIVYPLLEELKDRGACKENIFIIVATGKHRVHKDEDFIQLLGKDIFKNYKVISHDGENKNMHQFLGYTSNGTPLYIDKAFVDSDIRIITGMIEPHQFMGFTGGLKSVTIGIGYKETIEMNHKFMFDSGSSLGNIENNIARNDVDEITNFLPIDFCINAILGNHNEIVKIFAGDETAVWNRGVNYLKKMIIKKVKEPADIVIASPGGYPKDINLYQAQKGLAHASEVVKEGGSIILLAECREGLGNSEFANWMNDSSSPMEVVDKFKHSKFMLGAHKAYLFSKSLLKADVNLVSEKLSSNSSLSSTLKIAIYNDIQYSISEVFKKYNSSCNVIIIPKASSIIPSLC